MTTKISSSTFSSKVSSYVPLPPKTRDPSGKTHAWSSSVKCRANPQVPGEPYYYNFETNCIGAMVASRHISRDEDVQRLSPDEMARIERHCSFPREAIPERDGLFRWEVQLRIPLDLIFRNNPPVFPQTLRANFYKCADKTRNPHFVSWNPIPLPKPDFHCPQFFGEITLQ